MAAWPWVSATCSAVYPGWLRSSMLAPASSSSCTHSFWPSATANIRAVAPSVVCTSILALCSSSRRTMASLPSAAATMRAVVPLLPPRHPLDAAACSNPYPPSSSVSTRPPFFSHLTTGCKSPRFAALASSVGSMKLGGALVFGACRCSKQAIAVWPQALAICNAVSPFSLRSPVLAPASSSSCTHSLWSWSAAIIRAVIPSRQCRSAVALCLSNRRTMVCWPCPAAPMRAVPSSLQRRSTLAPRLSSSFATRRRPASAAVSVVRSPEDIWRRQSRLATIEGGGHCMRECRLSSGGRGCSHILQARRLEQHCLRLALHRHLVPTLGRVEAPRHATPPVELGPRLEAVDAHAAAREVGHGGGGGGRLGCVLPEQLGSGGVTFGLGKLQRRVAALVAQLGAGARR
eukprot:scaffold72053_cov63-Phaeocystis_antarctica.AAC.7